MVHSSTFVVRSTLVVVLGAVFVSTCQGVAVDVSKDLSISQTSSGHFLFWERCEDQWNEEKGVTEVCCKGNYKCSSDTCKDNRLCSIGFLSSALWCHNSSCKSKDGENNDDEKGDEADKDKNKDKKDKDKKDKDKKNKDKKDKDKKNKDKKKRDKKNRDKKNRDKKNKDRKDKKEKDGKNRDKKNEDKNKNEESNNTNSDPSPNPSPTPSSSPPLPTPSPSPPSQVVNDDPLHCDGYRRRREIRSMSEDEKRSWQQAIMTLRSQRDLNGDSEWDRLVNTHLQNNDEAHGGAYFMPWHRIFLLRLENALRKINPTVTLPYWDWTLDAADPAISPVWQEHTAGGARRPFSPIQNGAFQGMDARYPDRHQVLRNFNSGTSGDMGTLWGMQSLENLINGATFEEFSDGIEAAHALPHININGDMGDAFRAPNDPVFYLHHAFVDYLYSRRQSVHGKSDFGGTHDFQWGREQASADRTMAAFGVPANRAFSVDCVEYAPPPRRSGNMSGRGVRGFDDKDFCQDPTFEKGNTISRERCARGRNALRSQL